jgi:glyoxylase-like metal-dependent hydrolase (beta-lactamase superfamily II)
MSESGGGWNLDLLEAGTVPMPGGMLGPADELGQDELLPSNVLLLRGHGTTLLVDATAGPLDLQWFGAESDLAGALAAADSSLEQVELLLLTHLDFDHCGGVIDLPHARVVASRAARRSADGLPPWEVAPLWAVAHAGPRLELADDGDEVAPGVRVREAPGHRAGHLCVEVGIGQDRLVFLTDVIHHPRHVENPDWDREFDSDADLALLTRRALIDELAGTGVRVAASHIHGWGTIERSAAGPRWQAV